jgi:hypothetical protein
MTETIKGIVEDAWAFAREATSERVRNHRRTIWRSGDVEGGVVLDPVRYHRDDVADAALTRVAKRLVAAEQRAEMAVYVARIDAEREIRRELKIEDVVLYRSLSSGTFVIRREGAGEWLVDEPTIEACVARGIALGLLAGPKGVR